MSDFIQAIILGIIQGLTEFLPVSSSGHLELAKYFLNWYSSAENSLLMSITLHGGTAVSTLIMLRKEIKELIQGIFKMDSWALQFAAKIIVSMIPAVFVGLFLEDQIEALFDKKIILVGAMLILTGLLLFISDRAKNTGKDISWTAAIIIGIAQAVAIIPGISRSGATISLAVLLGIDRERSAKFSFLMVLPLIFGKMFQDALDGSFAAEDVQLMPLILGFVAALVTGIFAFKWMLHFVKNAQLKYFSFYCFLIGMLSIIIFYVNG